LNDLTLQEIEKIVPRQSAVKLVFGLIEKGLVSVYENLQDYYQPKREAYVFLQPEWEQVDAQQRLLNQLEKAPKQLDLMLAYLHLKQTQGAVRKSTLLKQAQVDAGIWAALVKKNIFYSEKLITDRLGYEYQGEVQHNVLNADQQEALDSILQSFEKKRTVLLHGITGSGKTHVYIELIQRCLAQGKQCLFLLPEIALTAQLIRKLRSYFGDQVGVYHSRFSQSERVEVWNRMVTNPYPIVVGARSAVLLPFQNLGLIIVDEEHDPSYKQQDPAPRYHARDAALYMANKQHASIILGSATPSLESHTNTVQGKYDLVKLKNRFGEAMLPEIFLVNQKQEWVNKTSVAMFSGILLRKMEESLAQRKQIILFQNRRGYAPYIVCKQCAWIPHCKYCDVSLTYHKQTDLMHCHYCGSKTAVVKKCLACNSMNLTTTGFGTEKIEEEVRRLFPKARIQRFDWDALKVKNKYQEVIRSFEKQQIDILIGTQMLVKGLDFDHVNLVGVLQADSMLAIPDFRINERVFQMLEQVSGRAGRKNDKGEVYIQLLKTEHPVIRFVQQHDYEGFYQFEMQARKDFQYPPFTRLIKITLKHKNQLRVLEAALELFSKINHLPNTGFFGPAEPGVAKVRNYFIQEILLKINKEATHVQQVKLELRKQIALLQVQKGMSNLVVQLDVDP
jgi:primosomal protein N' (replication factor Y)